MNRNARRRAKSGAKRQVGIIRRTRFQPAPNFPKTLDDLLEQCLSDAKAEFEKHGNVPISVVGIRRDGTGVIFEPKNIGSPEAKTAFKDIVLAQCRAGGLVRRAFVSEVWLAPDDHIRPSQSDRRKEAISVSVVDGGEARYAIVGIERNWETGKVTFLPTEYAESALEAHPLMQPE